MVLLHATATREYLLIMWRGFDYVINTTGVFMACGSPVGLTTSSSTYYDLWITTLKCAWPSGNAFLTFRSNGSGSVTATALKNASAKRTVPKRNSETFAVTNTTPTLLGSYRTSSATWAAWTGSN